MLPSSHQVEKWILPLPLPLPLSSTCSRSQSLFMRAAAADHTLLQAEGELQLPSLSLCINCRLFPSLLINSLNLSSLRHNQGFVSVIRID